MTHLSVKTLHHYHRVGLLEPAEIDRSTGYRYYTTDQVPTAQVIRRFRDLDMPVEEVRSVLRANDPAERNRLIVAHLDRMQSQLAQTQSAIASLRDLIDQPDAPEVVIETRTVGAIPAVAIVDDIEVADLGRWWQSSFQKLRDPGVPATGPIGGLYSTALFADEAGQATAYVPVPENAATIVIPAAELAVATHYGTHDDVDRTYGALGTYVAEHALGVDGPVRETYLVSRFDTSDMTLWRTEIGWPIFQTTSA